MIYFIRQKNKRKAPIKIGYSVDPHRRLRDLQTSSPYPLEIIRIEDGGLHDEKMLHNRFSSSKLQGEWFKPSIELKNYLGLIDGDRYAMQRILPDIMNTRDVVIYSASVLLFWAIAVFIITSLSSLDGENLGSDTMAAGIVVSKVTSLVFVIVAKCYAWTGNELSPN